MKIDSPALNAAGGLLATLVTRAWMSGMDCKVAYYDRSNDPAFPECRGQKIYLFWHEYHLRDMIDVGLIHRDMLAGLPAELATRLETLLEAVGE